jgi:aquaporin Z
MSLVRIKGVVVVFSYTGEFFMKRFMAEVFGTFFLTLAIIFSNDPLAVGLTFMAMVYVAGVVSGGHFNWAVSFAAWLRGSLKTDQLFRYMVAQVVGAFLASVSYFLLLGQYYVVGMPQDAPWMHLGLREMFLTSILCSVFLAVMTTVKFRGSDVSGLVLGLTLTAIATIGGLFFNPAVYLGVVASNLAGGTFPMLLELATFVGAPLAGGAFAAFFFKYFNPSEA